jgi:acyl-CoA synthetase (AMP-forming)/AMP-acid ligase II
MFDEYIRFQAAYRPDATALIDRRGSRTFAQLEAHVRRAALELQSIAAAPGQSVAIAVKSAFLEWVLILALARLGIASAAAADRESPYRITDDPATTGDGLFLLTPKHIARIFKGTVPDAIRVEPDPDALGRVLRTSGTQGPPKRVGMSWRALDEIVFQRAAMHSDIGGPWHVTTGIATSFEVSHVLAAWVGGRAAVAGVGLDAEWIAALKPRLLGAVPVQLEYLLDTLPADYQPWPVRIVSGGSAFPRKLIERLRAKLSDDLMVNYAMTEVPQIASVDLEMLQAEPRAAGYPYPHVDVRVIGADDRDLPRGEVGRLCFRSARMSMGYLDDPVQTAERYRNGWFYSNDRGFIREDGLIVVEGRGDEVMNLGGHKVLPETIEQAALCCANVREVAALAVPGPTGLDRCVLALVTDEGFDFDDLRAALSGQVPGHQKVDFIQFHRLPRNAMGKIDRVQLRERIDRWRAKQTLS